MVILVGFLLQIHIHTINKFCYTNGYSVLMYFLDVYLFQCAHCMHLIPQHCAITMYLWTCPWITSYNSNNHKWHWKLAFFWITRIYKCPFGLFDPLLMVCLKIKLSFMIKIYKYNYISNIFSILRLSFVNYGHLLSY